MRIRCPQCREGLDVSETDPLVEVPCPFCDAAFSLVDTRTETYGAGESRSVGHFQLLEKLGQGAFGSVWKAHDTDLDRCVALKLPRHEHLDEIEAERFLREARAVAQLRHPGIVMIHEVGRTGEQIYIVSDFLQGATLQEWLSIRQVSLRDAAELAASIAETLEHAHQCGVVHRDIKPANIMMDAEGRPHLTDFGLAKRDAGEITMTVEGQILGTPAYMSPEQARGEGHQMDARGDIYSLGVILFQLLTGELPFRGNQRMLVLQIINDEPASPRKLNGQIPRDLETIVLKCLAKQPSRRYQSAKDLAADLRRWLAGEPIQARPVGRVERWLRWCRRNRAVASLAAGVVLLLVAAAIGSVVYTVQLRRHAALEHQMRTEAEEYLRLALGAIDEMLTEVGEESLAHVPQMGAVRKSLLQKALELHRQLLKSHPSDPVLQLELARAQHRMGNIYELVGEHDRAKSAYRQAIRMCQRLQARLPEDVNVPHYLAMSHTMLGEVYRKTSPGQALRHFETALKLQKELRQAKPETNDVRRELSRTLNNLGLLFTETGQDTRAESTLKEGIERLKRLAQEADASPDVLADLGRCQINLGVLLSKQPSRESEAEAAYRDAIENLQTLVELDPENRQYRHKLAVALLDLGNYLMDLPNRTEDSVQSMRKANDSLSELCEDFPGIPLYWYDLANSHNSLANALLRIGDVEGVKQRLDDAHATLKQLAERFPAYAREVAEYHSLKGLVLGGLGAFEFQVKKDPDPESAQSYVESAIEHQRRAIDLASGNPTYVERLSGNHAYLAQILDQRGLAQQAETERKAAQEMKAKAAAMKASVIALPKSP